MGSLGENAGQLQSVHKVQTNSNTLTHTPLLLADEVQSSTAGQIMPGTQPTLPGQLLHHDDTSPQVALHTGDVSKSENLYDFVNQFEKGKLDDSELLQFFGIKENDLRTVLEPNTKSILELFYYWLVRY